MPNPESPPLALLLQDSHAALRRGDLSALAETAQVMEAALARLGETETLVELQALQHLAARNAVCLQASLRGIKSARRRLAEIAAAGLGTGTYDSQGRRAEGQALPGHLTQRL